MGSGRLTSDPADRLADELERRGIGAPAAILLDAHRPLLPLLGQGAIFLAPLLRPLLGRQSHGDLRRVLDDPTTYDRLVARLAGTRRDCKG